jgi:hypothetical protein
MADIFVVAFSRRQKGRTDKARDMASESDALGDEQAEPISENHTPSQKDTESPQILRAELQIPPSLIDAYKAQQHTNNRRERSKFWVEILTLIAISIYAGITYCMWREMQSGSAITQTLAESTKLQAENTEKLAQAALDQVRHLEAGVTEIHALATATQGALEQSRTALSASMEAARNDQRAWVGAVQVMPATLMDAVNNPAYLKEGSPSKFGVVIMNSGKSPALHTKTLTGYRILPAEVKFLPEYGETLTSQATTVLQPQMRHWLFTPPTEPVPASDIDSLRTVRESLYVYGKIMYEDIFRQSHVTTFCLVLQKDLATFHSCDTHNEAD